MSVIYVRKEGSQSAEQVSDGNPFPVGLFGPGGQPFRSYPSANGRELLLGVRTSVGRSDPIAHRVAITQADKLAVPTMGTAVDRSADGGTLLANAIYYYAVAAINSWGATICITTPPSIQLANDGNNAHVVRIPVTQVAGGNKYAVFLSGAAYPLWVGDITEVERASGIIINGIGTTTAGGAAGNVDVRLVGTGVASNASPYSANNAYNPDDLGPNAAITPIDCSGYTYALIHSSISITQLGRGLPTISLLPFVQNPATGTKWQQQGLLDISLLAGRGQSLQPDHILELHGARALKILVETFTLQSGQTGSIDIGVTLV